MSFAF